MLEIASEILKGNMNEAEIEVYAVAWGELPSKDPTSAGFNLDCSWNTKGWYGKEGVIASITESRGKFVNVVHKTLSCPQCKKMQTKRANNELSGLDYMSWRVEHELNCMMNYKGSSSVRIFSKYHMIQIS